MRKIGSVLAFLLLPFACSAGENEQLFDVFSIQAQAQAEVDNDEMQVILAAEHQNRNPVQLADSINRDMQWALNQVKKAPVLQARTLSYASFPVYEEQKIVAWQAVQQLELKSTDVSALNDMVGKLQTRLQVKHMSFRPTPATRKAAENKLIDQALDAFKARAELVRKNMNAKGYRVVQVDIHAGDQFQPIPLVERADMAMFSKARVAAPAVEAGTSTATVTVNGSIQLQR
ncbi:MAG TPA: SIMPL domain-containing protein [Gammaproteobacteria bacterium]